jgi:hypothetical protein
VTLSAGLADSIVAIDDFWEWDSYARARKMTDGLVLAPPTVERVTAILEELGDVPQELGVVPPACGVLTKEVLAVQCAMAGCLPRHARVVSRAIQLMLEPAFNLYGVQCTTNACAPLTIVSGPVVKEMGFHSREGVFGGGSHASAAVGRAIRLILWNVGGGYPGSPDMSPLGHPGKYVFLAAENGDDSPWDPIHTDFGFDKDESCVTVFACQPPASLAVAGNAGEILNILRESLPTPAENTFHVNGQYLVTLNPRVAGELSKGGYNRTAVREWLFERARYRVGRLREAGLYRSDLVRSYWGWRDDCGVDLKSASDNVELPMVKSVEDIHLLVAGGASQWWGGFLAGWGRYGGYARCGSIQL